MRVYHEQGNRLMEEDPHAYLEQIYGNEPKALKDSIAGESESEEEDDPDDEQSGGEGFNPGFEHEEIFSDKGKPGFLGFKNLVHCYIEF